MGLRWITGGRVKPRTLQREQAHPHPQVLEAPTRSPAPSSQPCSLPLFFSPWPYPHGWGWWGGWATAWLPSPEDSSGLITGSCWPEREVEFMRETHREEEGTDQWVQKTVSGDIWGRLEIFCVTTTGAGGVLLTSNGWRPGKLLNILQHVGQSPQQRSVQPTVHIAKVALAGLGHRALA